MRLRKTRILPMVLFILLIMGVVTCIGVVYIADRAVKSFKTDCGSYDGVMTKTARIIEQNIKSNSRTIEAYADLFRIGEEMDVKETYRQLALLSRHNQFELLALIDRQGKVYNQNGINFMLEQDNDIHSLFKKENKQAFIIRGGLREGLVAYGAPVFSDAGWIGYLIGTVDARINVKSFGEEMPEESGSIYVLDEKNQIIGYSGPMGENFDYASISPEDFYSPDGEYAEEKIEEGFLSDRKEKLQRVGRQLERAEQMEELSPGAIVGALLEFQFLAGNDNLLWYEKAITVGEKQQWKVVVSRTARLSEGILGEVASIFLLFCFLVFVFFVLLIIFVVNQNGTNRKLEKMAYWDEVTCCYNWAKFGLDARRLLRNRKQKYALVAFDIGRFRLINDMYGQEKGNQVLKLVAGQVRQNMNLRREAFSREYSDVFMLLLQYENQERLKERLLKLNEKLVHCSDIFNLHLSYGVYPIPDNSHDLQKMEIYASLSKDVVKRGEEESIAFFDDSLRTVLVREQEIENRMEEALEHREFQVYLQPKYTADGESVGGAEALVRWISREKGFLSPGEFIPIFERNRFIIKLDNYMLTEVCRQQKKWLDEGRELITISVNISRAHLTDLNLVEDIKSIVDSFALPHHVIELELTESAFFDDKMVLVETIKKLQDVGFLVSMDDFGSGYSSLNSLKDLPLNVVKLDGEFFHMMDENTRGEIVIKDTVALAKHLNMKIVAEGIETLEQVEFLRKIGCDLIQGYYFARPMPIPEYERMMYEK